MSPRLYNGVIMPDRPSPANVRRLDMSVLPMIDAMHEHGVLVDVEHFRKLGLKLDRLMEERLDRLSDLVGPANVVNPNSPPEVAELLFTKLGVHGKAPLKMADSGKWASTDSDQLNRFRGEHPAVDAILDYRHFAKLKSTYVSKMPRMLDSAGRLHTTFMPDRTATGRLASKDINLQNIPKRDKVEGEAGLGKEIRSGVVASPGYVLLARDLSQIEMRWGAHYSQEPVMIQGYQDPHFDMHTQTAMDVFGLPREQIDKTKHRLPAKTIGFGVLFMIEAEGLRSAIINAGAPPEDWPEDRCQDLIDRFYAARPSIRDWQAVQFFRARRYGMVWDAFGRVRLIPQVRSSLGWVRSEGLRQAANMPIQASAQGTLKLAMAELYDLELAVNARYGMEMVRVLLQLHDELLWEVREEYFQEWFETSREVMENGCPLDVPILSSGDVGDRWGEMETIH